MHLRVFQQLPTTTTNLLAVLFQDMSLTYLHFYLFAIALNSLKV